MKKLFNQHSSENEKQSKEIMLKLAASLIGKYVIIHKRLNTELSRGHGDSKKKGDCLCCIAFKLTKKMTQLEAQVGQISKVYEMAFGEELPLDDITDKTAREFYPLAEDESDNDIEKKLFAGAHILREGDDMPDGVRAIIEKLTGVLKSEGKDGQFSVAAVAIPKNGKSSFGVNPEDYPTFEAFRNAVTKARKVHKNSGMYDHRTGEEIIKENVIANTENFVANANAEADKPKRKRTGSKGPQEPRMN